jgi:hypothetical protein
MIDILLFILFAGIPYFVLFENTLSYKPKNVLFISMLLLLAGIVVSSINPIKFDETFIVLALFTSIFATYKAFNTTNFYRFGNYLIFVNAPLFMMFAHTNMFYQISLLVALVGIYLIGNFYTKNYRSANYHSITGVIVSTPYIGIYMMVYLIATALYPPFPGAIFLFNNIIHLDGSYLWYGVIAFVFFSSFLLSMRVTVITLFGDPNKHIHYVDFNRKEKLIHLSLIIFLLLLSVIGFKELVL